MELKTNEYRKAIADAFIKSLQENELQWKRGWQTTIPVPENAVTGKSYKGLNRFFLMLHSMSNNIADPRWATFKQIQDQGWRLNKGAKGMKVEYWMPFDIQSQKSLTWSEYNKLMKDPVQREQMRLQIKFKAKYYHVFQAQDITGIPELPAPERHPEAVSDEIIDKISRNMGVEIVNEPGDQPYYSIREDRIHLPQKTAFLSDYEYNSTALHELSHATGAEKRLNRDMGERFGTEPYAYEELVAEISSCYMAEHLQIQQTEEHINNHKAYVQGWIREISEKPAILMKAIRDAENSANYLEYQAELISEKEYQETLTGTREAEPEEIASKESVVTHEAEKQDTAAKQMPDLQRESLAQEANGREIGEPRIITQEIYEKVMGGNRSSIGQDFTNCIFKDVKFNWFQPQMPYTKQPVVDIVAFHKADFTGSQFTNCNFSSVQFRNSSFQNCCIRDCVFNRNHIDHCNLSNAMITGTWMNKVDITDSNLFKADISYTNLSSSQLRGNNFYGMRADGMEFKACFAIRNKHVDKIAYTFESEKQYVEAALGADDREAVSSVTENRQKELYEEWNQFKVGNHTEQEHRLVESWESRWNHYLAGISESQKQALAVADDIRATGFRATNGMVDHMMQMGQIAGKNYTLKDVCEICKQPSEDHLKDLTDKRISDSDRTLFHKNLDSIAQECRGQELALMRVPQEAPAM